MRARWVVAAVLVVAAAGVAVVLLWPRSELAGGWERWQAQGPDAYTMTVTFACGKCPLDGTWSVTVDGDSATVDGHPETDVPVHLLAPTVGRLYDWSTERVDRYPFARVAVEVGEHGVPTSFSLDSPFGDDEELAWTVESFDARWTGW